jgi:hypothetical protein
VFLLAGSEVSTDYKPYIDPQSKKDRKTREAGLLEGTGGLLGGSELGS